MFSGVLRERQTVTPEDDSINRYVTIVEISGFRGVCQAVIDTRERSPGVAWPCRMVNVNSGLLCAK